MSRVFILEDDEYRRSWFSQRFDGHELEMTADVLVAIEWLREREYDLIFLDHDLKDEHYYQELADDGTTGYVVALWLAENPEFHAEVEIIIHSLNLPGSKRMRECLQNSGRKAEHMPFPYLPAMFRRS
ncbi:MAG TPA: cyclic-phosphate processing receiver domain-containing protein [Pyrinomonadaceae bacterium]|jgi:CheY-like chemotaxis protein|nr:cyclic-phosphate processing receiver domain-containing protein [Pyrinomonadaceae bacterium]